MSKLYSNLVVFLLLLFFSIFNSLAQNPTPSDAYKNLLSSNLTVNKKRIALEKLLKKHLVNQDSLQYAIDLTAFAYWVSNTDLQDGINLAEKAIGFQKSLSQSNKKLFTINTQLLGSMYQKQENYEASSKQYEKIIAMDVSRSQKARAYNKLGENFKSTGNYHTAISYFQKAIELYYIDKNYTKVISTSIKLSITHQEIFTDKNIERGIKNLQELDTLRTYEHFSIHQDFLINETYGNLYNSGTKYKTYDCLPYYKKALELAISMQDSLKISSTYNNLGNIYHKKKNDSALYYFNRALKYPHNNDINTSRTIYNIGLCYLDQKKYNQAQNSFSQSLQKLKIQSSDSSYSEESTPRYKDTNLAINLLKSKAITKLRRYEYSEKKQQYLEEALLFLKQADQLIDLIKLESTHQESKLFWREQASDLYINLVKISFLLDNPKSAYYYLEKNKALLLLEDLTEERSKTFFNMPDSILKKELKLKRKIAQAQNNLKGSEKENNNSIILFDIKEEYELFMDSLQYKYPTYYKSKNNTDILSFEKVIKEAERKNTTFIHYILNDESGYGLVIFEKEQILYEIDSISLVHDQISRFKELISKPFYSKKDKKEFNRISKELYDRLLPNTIVKDNNSNLVIVPDQNLQSLPFEALMKKEGRYLIEDYDISYAYSISFLEQNKQLKRSYNKEFLGFAPINYKNNLPTLTKSSAEINEAAKTFDSDILLEEKASLQNLLNSLSDYKIIHLSTHANANDSITPWVATSTQNITLNDIYSTKNNAELITLSACNTSIGKLQRGEGVMSLARGFFNTGANSVVSTLWKADDESTQEIITDFYKHLRKGTSKSEALRLAKLTYLKNHSLSDASPYYWSSLVLIGNPEPMYSSINNWYILIGILISSLFIFLLYKRISKK
ncbi:CHAT domain-containing protein [uncultured Aquimarina sp.]|uniref:CHAT domain-containing protein n=1 Tax=uncultured Aquimarina sp. TaxID=575652 RepID=UPI00263762F3|nr:CHAT domain-containing protein [uncultured Aquimarina sp.]